MGAPLSNDEENADMPRKYGRKAAAKVKKTMHERKRGTLRSGRSGKKVTSRKQAIAIGLSEARRSGAKVPARTRWARKKKSAHAVGPRSGGPTVRRITYCRVLVCQYGVSL
jgi:hypothetical protein